MIDQFKQRLKEAEANVTAAKEERIRLSTQLDEAVKKRDEVVKKIEEKGLTIETIADVIDQKSKQLNEALTKLEQILPDPNKGAKEVSF